MRMRKFVKIGLIILVIVILLSVVSVILLLTYVRSTWTLPTRDPLPHNVEVIVADDEFRHWSLSPKGDKIVYETNDIFLLFPTRQQKQRLSYCVFYMWLDNNTLYCRDGSLIEIDNETGEMMTVPVHKINASDVDLEAMLQQAESIYNFGGNSDLSHALLLKNVANLPGSDKHYFVNNVENIEAVLHGYPVSPLPPPWPNYNEKIFSSDGMYYFEYNYTADGDRSLAIFSTETNDKISEFVEKGDVYFHIGGWSADNSGVYFEMDSIAMLVTDPTNLKQILKLKLPKD